MRIKKQHKIAIVILLSVVTSILFLFVPFYSKLVLEYEKKNQRQDYESDMKYLGVSSLSKTDNFKGEKGKELYNSMYYISITILELSIVPNSQIPIELKNNISKEVFERIKNNFFNNSTLAGHNEFIGFEFNIREIKRYSKRAIVDFSYQYETMVSDGERNIETFSVGEYYPAKLYLTFENETWTVTDFFLPIA